jgi:hypothetical protein
MPKYAVVVCPKCKNSFIIETGPKTVSCRSCNKRLDAASLKVFFSSDDFKEAQMARASVVASLSGDSAAFEEAAQNLGRDVMERIGEDVQEQRYMDDKRKVNERMEADAKKTKTKGQQAILVEAFDELSAKGDFSIEEYWAKISGQGITRLKFDAWVDKLVQSGLASSPKYGYIRKI